MSANVPPGDRLAQAESALRAAAVPDGPSAEVLAQVVKALHVVEERRGVHASRSLWRRPMILKLASAAVLVVSGILFYAAGLNRVGSAEAFAEAVEKVSEARTLSYRFHQVTTVGSEKLKTTSQVFYRAPARVRTEVLGENGAVSIMDLKTGEVLALDPTKKTALTIKSASMMESDRKPDVTTILIEDFRRLAGKKGEPVGEREIGGVRARGFRVKEDGQNVTVWVDPETREPLVVEIEGLVMRQKFRGTFEDIRIDPKLDDDLFRLEPPEGYDRTSTAANLAMTPERAVVKVLRLYAEASDGAFPSRLDDLDAFRKALARKPHKPVRGPLDPEVLETATAMAMVAVFVQKRAGDFGYQSKGIKLGDAKSIVFWYKPEGQETYKTVFGDLHVEDLPVDRLPER